MINNKKDETYQSYLLICYINFSLCLYYMDIYNSSLLLSSNFIFFALLKK